MNIIKSAKNANETFGETVNSAAAQTADSLGRAVDSARDRIDGVVNTVAASAAEVAQQAPAAAERVQAFAKNSLTLVAMPRSVYVSASAVVQTPVANTLPNSRANRLQSPLPQARRSPLSSCWHGSAAAPQHATKLSFHRTLRNT